VRLPTWLSVLRGVVLMTVGTAGMAWEIFGPRWDWSQVALFLGMIAGEGAWSGLWLIIRAAGTPLPPQLPQDSSPPSAPK